MKMKPSVLKKLNLIIEESTALKNKNKFQKITNAGGGSYYSCGQLHDRRAALVNCRQR